jgi:hypothetical protein
MFPVAAMPVIAALGVVPEEATACTNPPSYAFEKLAVVQPEAVPDPDEAADA